MEDTTPKNNQTPESLCRAIIARQTWHFGERVLEPARGDGNFYRNLPAFVVKDWCEIKEGRDFFEYRQKVHTIITNPPFKNPTGTTTLTIPFLEHSLELATKRVILLLNHNFLPFWLDRYRAWGWALTNLTIYSRIKRWFGLYYLLTFEKGGMWTEAWDNALYE